MVLLDAGVAETIRTKLQTASAPLKLADVAKGLTRPRKVKAADFQQEIQQLLEEDVRLGRAFSSPSGKDNRVRYWSRDEKQLLREKAVAITAQPQSLSTLKTQLAREVKGAAPAFIEGILRELISGAQLFEHPARTKKSGPLFGSSPPLPPLEQPKNKKALGKIIADCNKLAAAAGISAQDLLQALQVQLGAESPREDGTPQTAWQESGESTGQKPRLAPNGAASATIDELILKAVAHVPVLSLADLRHRMPPEWQGPAFDEAVLRLADQRRVVISQDVDVGSFPDQGKAGHVRDGDALFTTIAKWN